MLPDGDIGPEGFHDVIIENLAASPTGRSRHIAPREVTSLRRRWPKTVFRTMRRCAKDVERLRQLARHQPEWAFRHNQPGFCSVCQEQVASALDIHMMNVHLELGQLWRCPVEWCAVWKGSVSDCLGHLQDKHGGSQYVALKNITKFFPPWMVTRDLWQTALRPDVSGIAVDVRLFHESRCHLVHKYCVYKDPFPHPAFRGGGRYGCRAADESAHIDSSVGSAPGGDARGVLSTSCASPGTDGPLSCIICQWDHVLGDDPLLEQSTDIRIHAPVCPDVAEDDDMDGVEAVLDVPVPVLRPPPGFERFAWPQ